MNKVVLIGRMVKDPEVKKTQSDLSVCSFRIAVDRKFKDQSGNRQTDFLDVVAWRQLADIIGKYFRKGSRIGITGSLQSRSFEDQSGNKRTVIEVLAEDVDFLDPKQKQEEKPEAEETLPIPPMTEDVGNLPFDIMG